MVIKTDRLILRFWKLDDIDDLVEGLNNINVSKWLAQVPYPYTKEDGKSFLEFASKENEKSKNIDLAIVEKTSNKVIGGTTIANINIKDGTAGGGIWLNEKYQGKGYGKEAFYAKVKYSFDVLNLRRLENGYFPGNEATKKMQYKLGYKDEGIRRKKFYCLATKEYVDEHITGLLKEEFIRSENDRI